MTILKRLSEKRVVKITLSNDKKIVDIEEACDDFYSVDLNKTEMSQFINELQAIYNTMTE